MTRPKLGQIKGIVFLLCVLSWTNSTPAALADQPTVPPTPEEDELLLFLKYCHSTPAWRTDRDCDVVNHRPKSTPPPAVPHTGITRATGYIKSLYITFYGLASATHRTHVQNLLETTELNAIVMDVKGDRVLSRIPVQCNWRLTSGPAAAL